MKLLMFLAVVVLVSPGSAQEIGKPNEDNHVGIALAPGIDMRAFEKMRGAFDDSSNKVAETKPSAVFHIDMKPFLQKAKSAVESGANRFSKQVAQLKKDAFSAAQDRKVYSAHPTLLNENFENVKDLVAGGVADSKDITEESPFDKFLDWHTWYDMPYWDPMFGVLYDMTKGVSEAQLMASYAQLKTMATANHVTLPQICDDLVTKWVKNVTACQSATDLRRVIRDVIDEIVSKKWEISFEFTQSNKLLMEALYDQYALQFKQTIVNFKELGITLPADFDTKVASWKTLIFTADSAEKFHQALLTVEKELGEMEWDMLAVAAHQERARIAIGVAFNAIKENFGLLKAKGLSEKIAALPAEWEKLILGATNGTQMKAAALKIYDDLKNAFFDLAFYEMQQFHAETLAGFNQTEVALKGSEMPEKIKTPILSSFEQFKVAILGADSPQTLQQALGVSAAPSHLGLYLGIAALILVVALGGGGLFYSLKVRRQRSGNAESYNQLI